MGGIVESFPVEPGQKIVPDKGIGNVEVSRGVRRWHKSEAERYKCISGTHDERSSVKKMVKNIWGRSEKLLNLPQRGSGWTKPVSDLFEISG